MAEMALGLTKTVVEGALTRIQAAIEEEEKLKDEVQRDMVFVTAEFQMMQSFLKVANKGGARTNEVMMTGIRQLRDLAFDVENWVEFVLHMDPHESSTAWSRLCRAAPSWAVPRCLAPPRHLDQAAAEMKKIKARVEDFTHRMKRYNIFVTDDDDSKKVAAVGGGGASIMKNPSHAAFQILSQLWGNELHRFRVVDGDDDSASRLKKLLIVPDVVGDGDLQVIWLWGGEERDMSSLINKVYQDPEISNCFDHRAWVKITRPFKQEEFRKTLQDQLVPTNSTTNDDTQMQPAEMNEKRFLVVVEHVSDLVEWNTITKMCLPGMSNKSSRIVVSTQHLELPINYAGSTYLVSELESYGDDRPWICAFYKKIAERYCDDDWDRLKEKLKLGTVISVCGDGQRKSRLVKTLYTQIIESHTELANGMKFEYLRWLPVVGGLQEPLNLQDFSRRILLPMDHFGFYDGDLDRLVIPFRRFLTTVLAMTDEEVLQRSRRRLCNQSSLVVIHGLRSTKDWDDLRSNLLLPEITRCCCFVVVTDDHDVASYCADSKELLFKVSDANVGMGRISLYKREEAVVSLTSIFDRTSQNRRQWVCNNKISSAIKDLRPKGERLVSVFGMAGVGKSAAVKWFYSRDMLDPYRGRYDDYCRVEVPHPFSLEELSWRLLLELLSDYKTAKESVMARIIVEGGNIIKECQLWLRNLHNSRKKIFIVVDGVRSKEDWDAINAALRLSKPETYNDTIVITDDRSVAMHCVNNNAKRVANIHCLEVDEALRLFHQQIDYDKMDASEGKEDERVKDLSKRIVASCGGLPKVIAAVAEYYNKSLKRGIYLKLKDIKDNFMRILERDPSLSGLFSWMQSYLETSKDEIKPCIFYLPVFQVSKNVRRRRLLRRWTAEGYITAGENNGDRLFSDLVKFSMVRKQNLRKPSQFQVNGFFHEYITSRPLEDNLVLVLEGPCSLDACQRAGPPAQHLTVSNIGDTDEAAFRNIDFSRLRSLTVVGECRAFMFDPEKINMKYVRVLDLEDASGLKYDHLKHVVEVFPRLKFLSLRGCKEIRCLPKSLGGLRQLQTLDVRDTSIATLPEAILKLHKLQYVRGGTRRSNPWDDEGGVTVKLNPITALAGDPTTVATDAPSAPAEDATTVTGSPLAPAQIPTTSAQDALLEAAATTNPGVEVPAGIGDKLTTLQTFGVANVGTGRVILEDLRKLNELRRLAVCDVNPDNISGFFFAIKDLPHLVQLSVRLDKNNKDGQLACLDDTIQRPPKSLKGLKLYGHVHVLASSWIKELATDVELLDLEVTLQRDEDMLVILDQLLHHQNLLGGSRLCLKPIYNGKLTVGVTGEEPRPMRLDILEIVCTTELEATIVGEMPYIGQVKVLCSSGSSLQLSGLQQIRELKRVWLKGSFRDSLKQHLLRQLVSSDYKVLPNMRVFQPY